MKEVYLVDEDITLLSFLKMKKGKDAKNIFKKYTVIVNNKYIKKYDENLKQKDQVILLKKIEEYISILYEDKDMIIVTKPYHLLTVSDLKTTENTLYFKVSNYIKRGNKKNKLFVVHRLDYETSGLVIFAKSEKVKEILQKNWNHLLLKRGYQAIVHGSLLKNGRLIFDLKENRGQRVYVCQKDRYTKEAITNYQVIRYNDKYSLVDIEIETGRKHQIRVSFKEIGHPIVGDRKYGKNDLEKQMYLIANHIEMIHPITNKKIDIFIPMPEVFYKLVP